MSAPKDANAGPALWELALAEFRLNVRSAGLRVLVVLQALVTFLWVQGLRFLEPNLLHAGPVAGQGVRNTLESVLLLVGPLIVGGAAVREHRLEMDDLLLSKPPSSEAYIGGKFAGVFASLLVPILAAVLAAWAAQLLFYAPDRALLPALLGGMRVIAPLLFLSGLSFLLTTFARSALAAGIVVGLHLGVLAAGSSGFLLPVARFTFTSFHLLYALVGLTLVVITVGGWERRRQSETRWPRSWALAPVLLVAALGLGLQAIVLWRGWTLSADPALDALATSGSKTAPPLPDIPLRTVSGSLYRLAQWKGRPVIVVFWSPEQGDSVSEVAALERAWRDTAANRMGFVSACVTDDPVRGADVARDGGLREPVLWNPPPQSEDGIGLAAAFGVKQKPFTAYAGVIRSSGAARAAAVPVSGFPFPTTGHPPHTEWEKRLYALGVEAFRQYAEREH